MTPIAIYPGLGKRNRTSKKATENAPAASDRRITKQMITRKKSTDMKRTLSLSLATLLTATTISAKDLKIKIDNLRSDKGRILLTAAGDTRPRYAMAAPSDRTACVTFTGITADSLTLSIIHDENGNYRLDKADGKPAEGCIRTVVSLPAEKNEATVELRYDFSGQKTGTDTDEAHAASDKPRR